MPVRESHAPYEAPHVDGESTRTEPVRPVCPVCAAASEGPPDAYGVYPCRTCQIVFRPPWRVPVRHVGISETPTDTGNGWIGVSVVGALIVGLAIAAGDSKAPTQPPPLDTFRFNPEIYEPAFDPALLEGLELGMMDMVVSLDYEVHVSQISRDDLYLTGLIRNNAPFSVEAVSVDVRCLDAAGGLMETRAATVACARGMVIDEVCAWSLDAPASAVAGFEIEARAQRSLVEMPRIDLRARFDADGQRLDPNDDSLGDRLELDLEGRTVGFELAPGTTAYAVQASVASFDGQGQVLAVKQIEWPGTFLGGQRQSRPMPIGAVEGTQIYDLRLDAWSVAMDELAASPSGAP